MGNASQVQKCKLPQKAFRILKIQRISTAMSTNLSIFTDYIISPNLKSLDLSLPCVDLQVYSILDGTTRKINLQIQDRKLGMFVKLQPINQCLLKITKVFPNSPFAISNIFPSQFIVGVLGGQYTNLKQFVTLIKNFSNQQHRPKISFCICNQQGTTRLVDISMKDLKQWKTKNHGLLGCQLAQGWINQWKQTLDRKLDKQEKSQKLDKDIKNLNNNKSKQILNESKNKQRNEKQLEQSNTVQSQKNDNRKNLNNKMTQIPSQIIKSKSKRRIQSQDSHSSSQEIERKCNQLMDGIKDAPNIPGIVINPGQQKQVQIYNNGTVVEVKYRGILK